jgi:CubicO group peptidase (beta-lactamase class C family)
MNKGDVVGLQIGIINNNEPVYVKSYGYKNKALAQINDVNSSFYAASLAKPLFGYIVMQLVDEGVIDLDKPIYKYLPKPLPEYNNYKDLAGDDRWKLITPRMCLSHTTGFPNWREENDNKKLNIMFTPGTRYSYSGEGINLLQLVVETVTKKPLEMLAREKIFKPLHMTMTDYVWQSRFSADDARDYDVNDDTVEERHFDKAFAAGSMQTTINDYTRFMAAVLKGQNLSAKSTAEMLTPQIRINSKRQFLSMVDDGRDDDRKIDLAYGLGWGLFNTPYGKAFFKEGHIYGWVHYVIGFPDKKMALVIMSNSYNAEGIFNKLVENIDGITIPWYWEGYAPYRESVQPLPSVLKQITGEYDGKYKVIITLVNGQLKVESPTVNLGKTNLYAENDHHYFLRIMETDLDFVKDANRKVVKIVVDDEGDHYELTKVK